VALRYRNGRVHEATIEAPEHFGPGFEFEAYGRRWRVLDRRPGLRRTTDRKQSERVVCQCIG